MRAGVVNGAAREGRVRRVGATVGLVCVLALTWVAYSPTLRNGFTNWDDHVYVTDNQSIRELDGDHVQALFRGYVMGNYHPLTLLSYAFDYRLSSLDPRAYHRTSILLHLANTALVFLLARLLLANTAAALLAAALFGVHTLHVESVAWISARKDLVYAVFFFAALVAWVRYLESRRQRFYTLSLLLFVLSLLSKAMAMSFPLTLLALDPLYGRRPMSRRSLLEKAPFFALSLLFGVVAVLAQRASAAIPERPYAIHERIAFASYGLVQYVWRLIAPLHLSAVYPYPAARPGEIPPTFWIFPAVAAGLVAVAARVVRRRALPAFGLLFFVVNIAFVLQLLPVGDAIMADRYTYVASFGFFLAFAFAWTAVRRSRAASRAGVVVVCVYVLALALLTYERCTVWKDSLTLWNDVLAKYPHAVQALNNRGRVRYDAGDLQGAIADYTEVLRWRPNDPRYGPSVLYNRGAARLRFGDLQGAKADFTGVISARTVMLSEAYAGRGSVARQLGDLAGAITDFTRAIEVDSHSAAAWFNRGNARYLRGDLQGALGDYDRVLELQPDEARAWLARGKTHIEVGQRDRGCADLEQARRLGAPLAMELLRQHCGPDSAPGP